RMLRRQSCANGDRAIERWHRVGVWTRIAIKQAKQFERTAEADWIQLCALFAEAQRFVESRLRVLESFELNQDERESVERLGDEGTVVAEAGTSNCECALKERYRQAE